MENLYLILNIDKNATPQKVKITFRALAFKYHPDKNPNDKKAEEKFKEVSFAYEILSNPEKRKYYDRYGLTGEEQENSLEGVLKKFNEEFSPINNIEKNKENNIQEAGKEEGKVKRECKICKGSGRSIQEKGFMILEKRCETCEGTGFIDITPEEPPPVFKYKPNSGWGFV